jgi:hypothetical protein
MPIYSVELDWEYQKTGATQSLGRSGRPKILESSPR